MECHAGLLINVVESGVAVCKSPGVPLRPCAVFCRELARYKPGLFLKSQERVLCSVFIFYCGDCSFQQLLFLGTCPSNRRFELFVFNLLVQNDVFLVFDLKF